MDKIKVSKEVAHALEVALKLVSKETLLNDHASKLQWNLDVYRPLNQISNWEMAQILINGYEVEETPEEELLKIYKSHEIIATGSEPFFIKGIKTSLHILGIKIKGIND